MSAPARNGQSSETQEGLFEEEALGKAYDARLLRRLWPYVRPYWPQVVFTVLMLAPLTLVELLPALIVRDGIEPPKARVELFPKERLPLIQKARGAARVAKLLPHAIPGMEIDRMELAAGGRMVGVPHRPGTHEYLCCEKGRLVLVVAGERLELGAGDVAAFAGDQRHSYENPGRSPAVAFSVVTLAPVAAG